MLGCLLKTVWALTQIATLHRDLGIACQGEIAQTLACNVKVAIQGDSIVRYI